MQYVFFEKKGIHSVQWGLRQGPRSWGIFVNFVSKVTLPCKVTFNCKLQKKLATAPPVPAPMCQSTVVFNMPFCRKLHREMH